MSFSHYLQRAVGSFLASGAVSGRGHWSRKARPSPSWALPSSGCSPPPPDRYCCQTPLWEGKGSRGGSGGRKWKGREKRRDGLEKHVMRFDFIFSAKNSVECQSTETGLLTGLVVIVAACCMHVHFAYFVFIWWSLYILVIQFLNFGWSSLMSITYLTCSHNKVFQKRFLLGSSLD